MFLFRASKFLSELNAFRPDIYSACSNAVGTINPLILILSVLKRTPFFPVQVIQSTMQ